MSLKSRIESKHNGAKFWSGHRKLEAEKCRNQWAKSTCNVEMTQIRMMEYFVVDNKQIKWATWIWGFSARRWRRKLGYVKPEREKGVRSKWRGGIPIPIRGSFNFWDFVRRFGFFLLKFFKCDMNGFSLIWEWRWFPFICISQISGL